MPGYSSFAGGTGSQRLGWREGHGYRVPPYVTSGAVIGISSFLLPGMATGFQWMRNAQARSLAWLLHQPAVTAPIIGPRTAGQLDGALAALEITLDDRAPRSAAAVPVTSRCPSRA